MIHINCADSPEMTIPNAGFLSLEPLSCENHSPGVTLNLENNPNTPLEQRLDLQACSRPGSNTQRDQNHPMLPVADKKLLDAKGVAVLLDVSLRTIWNMRDSGRIPKPVKVGRLCRWRRAEIERWIKDGCPKCRPTRRRR